MFSVVPDEHAGRCPHCDQTLALWPEQEQMMRRDGVLSVSGCRCPACGLLIWATAVPTSEGGMRLLPGLEMSETVLAAGAALELADPIAAAARAAALDLTADAAQLSDPDVARAMRESGLAVLAAMIVAQHEQRPG